MSQSFVSRVLLARREHLHNLLSVEQGLRARYKAEEGARKPVGRELGVIRAQIKETRAEVARLQAHIDLYGG